MISPNEFWLSVHRIAVSYEAEGLTPAERTKNIIEEFRRMPHLAQRELLDDLFSIATHLPELYMLAIAAAANESEGSLQEATMKAGGGAFSLAPSP
jgi:hypothetical protein